MSNYPKVNYIGNKEKLVSWLIREMPVRSGTVLDLFAGGSSVAYALKEHGYSVLVNDILYADYVLAKALVENETETLDVSVFQRTVLQERERELEEKFSFLAKRLYFPEEIAELAHLVAISETLSGNERYLFLALIRRAMIRKLPYSRMNVPWNQIQRLRDEDYSYAKYGRRRAYHNQTFESHMRENLQAYNDAVFQGKPCQTYRCDVMELADQMQKVDVVYMDPPYPSTMNNYDAFYGLYDEMFDKKKDHTDFTQKAYFLEHMEQLIQKLRDKTDYIVLSQNTRVKPQPEEICQMMEKYGTVKIREKKHNYQVTGKELKNASKELLFILEMDKNTACQT